MLIELELEKYTDYVRFEKLAHAYVVYNGYAGAKSIGGVGDLGVDGEYIGSVKEGEKVYIFQYTLQKDTKSKIVDTVKKLTKNNVQYDELCLVTSQEVLTKGDLRATFRKEHKGKNLEIWDRRDLVPFLSKNPDIHAQYFGSIQEQLRHDLMKSEIFDEDTTDALEMSMLKCALLYHFSSPNETRSVRKELFDKMLLSILVGQEKGLTVVELQKKLVDKIHRPYDILEIQAGLQRLGQKDFVTKKEPYEVTGTAIKEISTNQSQVEKLCESLIDDMTAKSVEGITVSTSQKGIIRRNIKRALNLYFMLYGGDFERAISGSDWRSTDQTESLFQRVSEGLPEDIAQAVKYGIGRVLQNPTETQKNAIILWGKAFVGSRLMQLDPKLSNFQANKLKDKVFILDTDFVLHCLVKNTKLSGVYKHMVAYLKKIGCKMLIPQTVVDEVVKHAEVAEHNYNYFSSTFDAVDREILMAQIKNVFVLDYYMRSLDGNYSQSFRDYIENYYDDESPRKYMIEVMRDSFKGRVEIDWAGEEVSISPTIRQSFIDYIYDLTLKTEKAQFRTSDENRGIATADADLFLMTWQMNQDALRDNNKELLSANAYLLTNTTRAIKCSSNVGLSCNAIVRPTILLSLLDELGYSNPSKDSEFMLFDNPFLAAVTDSCWDDVKCLVDQGVSLRGKNVTRLKKDLEGSMHKYMITPQTTPSTQNKVNDAPNWAPFVREVMSKGYTLTPGARQVIAENDKIKAEMEQMKKELNALRKENSSFKAKRQKYKDKLSK